MSASTQSSQATYTSLGRRCPPAYRNPFYIYVSNLHAIPEHSAIKLLTCRDTLHMIGRLPPSGGSAKPESDHARQPQATCRPPKGKTRQIRARRRLQLHGGQLQALQAYLDLLIVNLGFGQQLHRLALEENLIPNVREQPNQRTHERVVRTTLPFCCLPARSCRPDDGWLSEKRNPGARVAAVRRGGWCCAKRDCGRGARTRSCKAEFQPSLGSRFSWYWPRRDFLDSPGDGGSPSRSAL